MRRIALSAPCFAHVWVGICRAGLCACILFGLLACTGPRTTPSDVSKRIYAALADKTLTNEAGARLTLERSGRIVGAGVVGQWWVEDDLVCRTLLAPEAMAGTTCQKATFSRDRVVFYSPGGRTLSFRIED